MKHRDPDGPRPARDPVAPLNPDGPRSDSPHGPNPDGPHGPRPAPRRPARGGVVDLAVFRRRDHPSMHTPTTPTPTPSAPTPITATPTTLTPTTPTTLTAPIPLRTAPALGTLRRLRVRAELLGTTDPHWRLLSIPADLPLDEVHARLQIAFGWLNTHLHRFSLTTMPFDPSIPALLTEHDLDGGAEGIPESSIALGAVLQAAGDTIHYLYDFADRWHLRLTLEAVEFGHPEQRATHVIDGARDDVPENAGGIECHEKNMATARAFHPLAHDPDERARWVYAYPTDDLFARDRVNRALQRREHAPDALAHLLRTPSGPGVLPLIASAARGLSPEAQLLIAAHLVSALPTACEHPPLTATTTHPIVTPALAGIPAADPGAPATASTATATPTASASTASAAADPGAPATASAATASAATATPAADPGAPATPPSATASTITPGQAARLLHPLLTILGRWPATGMRLTAAGYLAPAEVTNLIDMIDPNYPGPRGTEAKTEPVFVTRLVMQRLGLLAATGSRLVLTRQGLLLREDAPALWAHLAASMPLEEQADERDVAALLILLCASGEVRGDRELERDLDLLARVVGWQFAHSAETLAAARLTHTVLRLTTGKPHRADDHFVSPLGTPQAIRAARAILAGKLVPREQIH